jgi:hypothetical protein
VGDYPIRQLVQNEKDFGWMAFWEKIQKCWDRFGWWPLRFGGGGDHFDWRPPWLGKAGSAPFELYPGICPTTEGKHGKPQRSRVVGDYSLRRLGRLLRESLDWPAEHQSTSVTRGWLQSALGRHKCLTSCRTNGFSASTNFESKLCQCSDKVGEKWNLQILVNLPVTNVPRCVSRNAKTLGF